jgi:hypothetical protein
MEYAGEVGLLTDNPLKHVRWTRPRTASGVDPRVVLNAEQAERFWLPWKQTASEDPGLSAFFACLYYAALRPQQASELRRSAWTMPDATGQGGKAAFGGIPPSTAGMRSDQQLPSCRPCGDHRPTADPMSPLTSGWLSSETRWRPTRAGRNARRE